MSKKALWLGLMDLSEREKAEFPFFLSEAESPF